MTIRESSPNWQTFVAASPFRWQRRRGSFQLTNYGQPPFVEDHYAWAAAEFEELSHEKEKRKKKRKEKRREESKTWGRGNWGCELTFIHGVTYGDFRPKWTMSALEIWMESSKEQDARAECKSIGRFLRSGGLSRVVAPCQSWAYFIRTTNNE